MKSFTTKTRKGAIPQALGFLLLRLCMVTVVLILSYILFDIISKGYSSISFEFLSEMPREGMTQGGIFPAILGTFYLAVLTTLFSVPLGVFSAIYLNEYSRPGVFTRIVRMAIRNLSGVPSIVFGLFGMAFFIQYMGLRPSLLASSLTLALLTLPVTITSSEEALKTVPDSYREGSLALGATKSRMIGTIVLPQALPGMLTGAILGLSRAAGETAPILFTGAAFFLPFLPDSVMSQFMALPYHLYIMATQHHSISTVRPIAYGTAFVLVVMIVILNMMANVLRIYFRKKVKRH
ncbi:MAG: phosphate ABC transporter permease PstA [Clostridia bacterium]